MTVELVEDLERIGRRLKTMKTEQAATEPTNCHPSAEVTTPKNRHVDTAPRHRRESWSGGAT
jgi:hypothetical protein